MTEEGLIRAAYAAINARDLEGLLALLDPAVRLRSLAVGSRAGAWFRGYGGVRDWWEAMIATYEAFRFTLLALEVHGDRAVAELRAAFIVGGHEVTAPAWQSARFRAGRILSWARWGTEAEARADAGLQRAG